MNEERHELHKLIGDILLKEFSGYAEFDEACVRNKTLPLKRLPLFCSSKKSNETEYCDVDALIIKDKKVKVIIEIEESHINPTQICGKFLTSALSSHFIHDSKGVMPLDDSVTFIQVIETSRLKEKTSKKEQFGNIERSIKDRVPLPSSRINDYKLIFGTVSDFQNDSEQKKTFVGIIKNCMR